MFQSFRSWATCVAMACGIVIVSLTDCRAQNFTSDVNITTPSHPRINLGQDGTSMGHPARTMSLIGFDDGTNSSAGFVIKDGNTGLNPFWLMGNAPANSILIAPTGNIGFGTTAPQTNLHVKDATNVPTLRLEDISGSPHAWDISADHQGFDIVDVTGFNATPFTILPGAPSNSLYVDANGSIGMGTSTPSTIGLTTTGGRFINVRNASGPARFVLQGAVGGELNLVHLNAPTNRRNFRIRSEGGFTGFHVVNDGLTGFQVLRAIQVDMSNGNIGLRVASPSNPLELASGAKCTAGGVWTNASSRELKQDIMPLTTEEAREAVQKLQPVGYRYKSELNEQYVGFIAEDVPDLVARKDRKSLAPMDIAAVLTKVVQDQDRQLAEERGKNAEQQKGLDEQRELIIKLTARLNILEQKLAASAE